MRNIAVAILFLISLPALAQDTGANVDSLKRVLALAKDDSTKAILLNQLAWAYIFVHTDSGMQYAKQSLQLAERTGNIQIEYSNIEALVLGLAKLGNFREALDYGFKGAQLAQSRKDTAGLSRMYAVLIGCYRDQEDYNEALAFGNRAKQIMGSEHFDTAARLHTYGFIASVYEKTYQLDSALYYAKIAEKLTDDWSGLFLTLGIVYTKKDLSDSAFYYFRKSIPFAQQQHVYIDLIDTYSEMSKIFESKGQKDSAIYYANLAMSQEGITTYPDGALRSALQLANVYELTGAKDSVIKYQKVAISIKDRLFDRQKTLEAQRFIFDESMRQQKLQQRLDQANLIFRNKLNIYFLLGGLTILIIVAGGLWRRNVFKQRSFALLQRQKQEIDVQREKAEKTLDELKTTQAQLIQSEKMASLGELTAGIAHEIQNPLNFVNNFSDVNKELLSEMKEEMDKGNIEDAKSIASDVIENEQKINHHGKRADAIVKGMLQHSRTSSSQKEPTDINALADEYLRLAYHGLRAKDKSFNAKFETNFDPSIGKINIVPQEIGRVVLNLINNAFYAVSEKQKAEGKMLNAQGEKFEPCVSVQTKKLNGKIEIVVKDNGNGIPQNVTDKIFQPFFTTKPTGQGTGLGLSLAYDIIKAHGGEIRAETREYQGSDFIIQLPVQ